MKELDAALYAKLTTPATTLYGLVGTKVFDALAPQGTAFPYVVYNAQAGGLTNETQRDFVDELYQVKGLGATQGAANAIDDLVYARLHNATFTVSGWNLVSCMRETEVQLDEAINGQVIFHRGAFYRIRLDKSS